MSHFRARWAMLGLLCVGCHARTSGEIQAAQSTPPPSAPSVAEIRRFRDRLDEEEDRAEALADELVDLAELLRALDTTRVGAFFTSPALFTPPPSEPLDPIVLPSGALPSGPGPTLLRHGWKLLDKRSVEPREVGPLWSAFLSHFSTLEDVRFKLKRADFNRWGTSGDADAGLIAIGRDREGHREWVRGAVALWVSRAPDGKWAIQSMRIESLESMVAREDLFSEVSEPAGVAKRSTNNFLMEVGAAAGDIDRDGDVDLFVVGDGKHSLYLNDGAGHFTSSQAADSLRAPPMAKAPLLVDIDNDGDLDLVISVTSGGQLLYENRLVPDGQLAFRDISESSGFAAEVTAGWSPVAGDVNNDGLPDIFIAGYGRLDIDGPNSFPAKNGARDLLFVNQGGNHFKEMARELGVDNPYWTFSGLFGDFDGDGDQDLYLSNDFGRNSLYRNEGGRFREATSEVGADVPGAGMGAMFGDYDNDGDLDLHATYMSSTAGKRVMNRLRQDPGPLPKELGDYAMATVEGNRLYENRGDGTYADVTQAAGPFPASWGWGGGFIDYDNDGYVDLHAPNGNFSGKSIKDT